MRQFILTVLLLVLACAPTNAAKHDVVKGIPKKVSVVRPEQVDSPMLMSSLSDFYSQTSFRTASDGNYWDVYSDRDDNITYCSDNKRNPFNKLMFGDKVRIAKISNGFALVYEITDDDSQFPEIPGMEHCMGWVPIANLLLTDYAALGRNNMKARILLKYLPNDEADGLLSTISYKHPDDNITMSKMPLCNNTFYYFMKSVDDRYLLSKQPVVLSVDDLVGWIDKDDLLLWIGRGAVEPAFSPVDIIALQNENTNCPIMIVNEETAIGIINYNAHVGEYSKDYYRLCSGRWRFPIITTTFSQYHYAIPSSSEFLQNPSNNLLVNTDCTRELSRVINYVFVIDGSRMYEPYFPILADKIASLKGDNFGYNVNVGFVIYHDSRNAEHMIEYHRLINFDNNSLYNFIDAGGTYGFKENLSQAPLMNALSTALNLFPDNGDNYLVVLGGRGDDSDGPNCPMAIADEIIQKNVKLYSIQFNNNNSISQYRNFNYIMNDIAQRCIATEASSDYSMRIIQDENISISRFQLNHGKYVDFPVVYSIDSGLMSEDQFSLQIDELFDKTFAIDGQTDAVTPFVNASSDIYSPSGIDYFATSLLFSESEMEILIDCFERFSSIRHADENGRKSFLDCIEYAWSAFGMPENKKIKNMGYRLIMSEIEGNFSNKEHYDGVQLDDIMSASHVGDAQFMHIIKEYSEKYLRLLEIRNKEDIYSMIIDGDRYYWIPTEDLF